MKPQGINTAIGDFLNLVDEELRQALTLFRQEAETILDTSGVHLNPPAPSYFSLDNNFFSALFLYSYVRGGIPAPHRIYYAAMNQCLRGMVTGCDNILDNEYKITLDTDLPKDAIKFRSVLDIMVCDRVLTALMARGARSGIFSPDQHLTANVVSLHALLKSGAQEASEEKGISRALAPDVILSRVHSVKTGLLFQAPWALPEALEGPGFTAPDAIKQGLFLMGMGCQILDDMVDLARDLVMQRHNYVASLIYHGNDRKAQKHLSTCLAQGVIDAENRNLLNQFPETRKKAGEKARGYIKEGCGKLFALEHSALIPFALDFLARRIGADRFLEPQP